MPAHILNLSLAEIIRAAGAGRTAAPRTGKASGTGALRAVAGGYGVGLELKYYFNSSLTLIAPGYPPWISASRIS